MTDVLTPEQRRLNMSRIRSGNTKPELLVRRALQAAGLRYRIHRRDLPGTPDIVFARQRVAIFVHGCFWHGHDCRLFKLPGTRREFWQQKIEANVRRDKTAIVSLQQDGWRVFVVWECAIKGAHRRELGEVVASVAGFLADRTEYGECRCV